MGSLSRSLLHLGALSVRLSMRSLSPSLLHLGALSVRLSMRSLSPSLLHLGALSVRLSMGSLSQSLLHLGALSVRLVEYGVSCFNSRISCVKFCELQLSLASCPVVHEWWAGADCMSKTSVGFLSSILSSCPRMVGRSRLNVGEVSRVLV